VDPQPFANCLANRDSRVQRSIRVLKDQLDCTVELLLLVSGQPSEITAVKDDRTGARRDNPQNGSADRRLPAAGFTDETKRLARVDVERHIVDRVDLVDGPPQDATTHWEMLDEVFDRENWPH
jgi:hypothetical protein